MLSIGLPHGQPGLDAYQAINEAVGLLAPSIPCDGYRYARMNVGGKVRWDAYFRIREAATTPGRNLTAHCLGGLPHLIGPGKVLVRLDKKPQAQDPKNGGLHTLDLTLCGPWADHAILPVLPPHTPKPLHPLRLKAFLTDLGLLQKNLQAVSQNAPLLAVAQLGVLALNVQTAERPADLTDPMQTLTGTPTPGLGFPHCSVYDDLNHPEQFLLPADLPNVMLRGTLEAVEFRANDLRNILTDRAPGASWNDQTGRFICLRVKAVDDMVFEVACREQDLRGPTRVGSAVQVQGLATVNLIRNEGEDTAWQAHPSGWEPVTLHDRNPDAMLSRPSPSASSSPWTPPRLSASASATPPSRSRNAPPATSKSTAKTF